MTIAQPFPKSLIAPVNAPALTVDSVVKQTETAVYNRILILLDDLSVAQQAMRMASQLAREHDAEIVMIGKSDTHTRAIIERQCRSWAAEEIRAHGYTISGRLIEKYTWLLNTEKPDAVIVASQPPSGLDRLFGGDLVANLQNYNTIDVFPLHA